MKKLSLIIFALFACASSYSQLLFAAKEKANDLYGFIDVNGTWVIPPAFEDAYSFSNGFARVMMKGHWGYINAKGKLLAGYSFVQTFDFQEGVARARAQDKTTGAWAWMGLIDSTGHWVAQPIFSNIREFSDNGLAMAKHQNGDWGFIDKKGNWIIQPKFSGITPFSDGLAMTKSNGDWGYLDEKGAWAIQPTYPNANKFNDGLAVVEFQHGWGYIDKQNHLVGEVFGSAQLFSCGVGAVKDEKWGIIDRQGKWIVNPTFDYIYSFVDGFARAREKTLWGFINTKGEWVVKPVYRKVYDFSEGVAQASQGDLWGYIDQNNNWIAPAKFQNAGRFCNGYAIVKLSGKWGIMDKTGRLTAQPTFAKLKPLSPDEQGSEVE